MPVSRRTTGLMQAGLTALYVSRLARLLAPLTRGKGVVFTLHSVSPEPPSAFDPNGALRITPDFLETAIQTVRKAGYEIVSLDEAATRLKAPEGAAPFACFTLDDGYRDNRDHAYPVFRKHAAPFAIYVPTAYADGEGELWWYALEAAVRKADSLRVVIGGAEHVFDTSSPAAKSRAFRDIYWPLRDAPECELRASVRKIAQSAGYDSSSLCRDLVMDWDELRALAEDPLVTIGAHTCTHYAVARLSDEDARREISASVARIEKELGRPCRHFSFPYGDSSSCGPRDFAIAEALGLETAVTTHKDVLRARYAMTGLPRVSLNGHFQGARYLETMLTGVPFLVFDAATAAFGAVRAPFQSWRRELNVPARSHPGAAST